MTRIGLATCAALPDLQVDDQPLLAALPGSEPVVWDDPRADWGAYDLVVVRSCWDYTLRREEFLAWARSVPRLVNDLDVLGWNTDKTYLAALEAAGVPVIATTFVQPGQDWTPAGSDVGAWVVKPTVSAGARDTWRTADPLPFVRRLHASGRTAMVQPYLAGIDAEGETAVVLFAGPDGGSQVSHGARKAPLLVPDAPDPDDDDAIITVRVPTPDQVEVAKAAVACLPGRWAYARVDLVPGPDGPVVLELEATEPSLFLRQAPGSAERFAAVLRAHAG